MNDYNQVHRSAMRRYWLARLIAPVTLGLVVLAFAAWLLLGG